jgi:hypothetical protein
LTDISDQSFSHTVAFLALEKLYLHDMPSFLSPSLNDDHLCIHISINDANPRVNAKAPNTNHHNSGPHRERLRPEYYSPAV